MSDANEGYMPLAVIFGKDFKHQVTWFNVLYSTPELCRLAQEKSYSNALGRTPAKNVKYVHRACPSIVWEWVYRGRMLSTILGL